MRIGQIIQMHGSVIYNDEFYSLNVITAHARGVIDAAIKHWIAYVPCLKFVKRDHRHVNYVSFFAGGG